MRLFKKLMCNSVRLATLIWLVCHFTLTVGYVLPMNPLKMIYNPYVQAIIGTYFTQNWSLFAPNPLSNSNALLARCLSPEEFQARLAGSLPPDSWQDISTPVWKRFQQNRFSAYDRLIRPQSNAIRQYLGGSDSLKVFLDSCKKGSAESCQIYERHFKLFQAAGANLLAKIGSSFCQETSPGVMTHVALRMRSTPALPWSERYTGEPKFSDYELGVFPINRSVPTSNLYRVER